MYIYINHKFLSVTYFVSLFGFFNHHNVSSQATQLATECILVRRENVEKDENKVY